MLEKNRNNIGDTFCTNKKISKICRVMHYAIVTLKNLKFRKTIVKNSSQDSNVIIGHMNIKKYLVNYTHCLMKFVYMSYLI